MVRGVSGRVPLTVSRSSPRSVCLDPGVQYRAPVQLSNTVSQVLARPSEWLELFKASRKRDAFFFVLWAHNKVCGIPKTPLCVQQIQFFSSDAEGAAGGAEAADDDGAWVVAESGASPLARAG